MTPEILKIKAKIEVLETISLLFDKKQRAIYTQKHSLTYFRRQLKAMRRDFGYTQDTMAVILGVSKSRYSQIERGSCCDITLRTAARIADVFNCSVRLSLVPFTTLITEIKEEVVAPVTSFPLEHSGCELDMQILRNEMKRLEDIELSKGKMEHAVGNATRKRMTQAQLSRYRILDREKKEHGED